MEQADREPRPRIRKIDWRAVLRIVESAEPGTPFLIGRMHRSVATHLNQGRYEYIDPARYRAWSDDERNGSSNIWLTRKP
jgi:hypothetical protein